MPRDKGVDSRPLQWQPLSETPASSEHACRARLTARNACQAISCSAGPLALCVAKQWVLQSNRGLQRFCCGLTGSAPVVWTQLGHLAGQRGQRRAPLLVRGPRLQQRLHCHLQDAAAAGAVEQHSGSPDNMPRAHLLHAWSRQLAPCCAPRHYSVTLQHHASHASHATLGVWSTAGHIELRDAPAGQWRLPCRRGPAAAAAAP